MATNIAVTVDTIPYWEKQWPTITGEYDFFTLLSVTVKNYGLL